MSKLGELSEQALELAEKLGEKLQLSGDQAGKWLQTGAALGVARAGAKTAKGFVKRNPVTSVAIAAGVGLLAFAAYRRHRREALEASVEGASKQIVARKQRGQPKALAPPPAKARKSRVGKTA
ncbi:hypothetical protein CSC70_02140 [Pseudoxanthomonas kalamensis DSM 18571]|uniref:hypothetical protein n=1 Tax=Pseudoxanthomonas kalamensis TaxID=289483 RepID=UPI00139096F7|nr:hypothetical protein [Pseudoxanthomonas kalamensis]KAF1712344.1 hypothetical protein CSC70_02140 [Pseudoxanthomonas kalamensis DSM 18571]